MLLVAALLGAPAAARDRATSGRPAASGALDVARPRAPDRRRHHRTMTPASTGTASPVT
jgi:hypothetical protein